MIETDSWAWYPGNTWPGFSPSNPNNIGSNGNGLSIDPASYAEIAFRDANNVGVISDADTDDVYDDDGVDHDDGDDDHLAVPDSVFLGGQDRIVHEVARFSDSHLIVDGQSYPVSLVVWVFADGTYMVRLDDVDIPQDMHHKQTTEIQLGKWDGREYAGSYVATRTQPFVCFVTGTQIATPEGPVPVERLRVGDRVLTLDHGPQTVLWVGCARVRGDGPDAPVRLEAGALGNLRTVWLSPLHRVLVTGWMAEMHLGEKDVLVPVAALVNGHAIRRVPRPFVTYVHVMCAAHEIVFADGMAAETLLPGSVALDRLGATLVPDMRLARPGLPKSAPSAARRLACGWEGRMIGQRLALLSDKKARTVSPEPFTCRKPKSAGAISP